MHGDTVHSFGMEPSISDYLADLDAADHRWAAETEALLADDDLGDAAFEPFDAIVSHGMTTVPGSGAFSGWTLSGYTGHGTAQGFHLTAPAADGSSRGPTVGFVRQERDGTWSACHDGFNHRPGVALGCTGTRVRVPSADAAYRHVILRHRRHLARYGR